MIVPKSFRKHNLRASLAVRSAVIRYHLAILCDGTCMLLMLQSFYISFDMLFWLKECELLALCICVVTACVCLTSQHPCCGDSLTHQNTLGTCL